MLSTDRISNNCLGYSVGVPQNALISISAQQERNPDYLTVPQMYKSRLVGSGNFKTTEGLQTDSLAADVKLAQHCVQLVRTGSCFHSTS